MSEIINAVTKFRQSNEFIKKMAEQAIQKPVSAFSCQELSGGLCNAVYLVECDGLKMVLKIASEDDVKVMRHEYNYVTSEAKLLSTLNQKLDLPIPKMIYADESRTLCKVPYFFMSYIEGKPLGTMNPRPSEEQMHAIKYAVGDICRQISSIQVEKFGIPAIPETYTDSNYEFVDTLFRLLLQDAEDMQIEIPGITKQELFSLLEQNRDALDMVKTPYMAHTDTWDGNLMIQDGKLSGLVDFAAILYGDPLINHDFHDFSATPNPDFMDGYGKMDFTKEEWTRILIYKIWQRLGMIVERGFRHYDDPGMYSWVLGEFTKEVENLKKINE